MSTLLEMFGLVWFDYFAQLGSHWNETDGHNRLKPDSIGYLLCGQQLDHLDASRPVTRDAVYGLLISINRHWYSYILVTGGGVRWKINH